MAAAVTIEALSLPLCANSDKPVLLGTLTNMRVNTASSGLGKESFRTSPTNSFHKPSFDRKPSFDQTPTPNASEYTHPGLLWPVVPSPMPSPQFTHGWPGMNAASCIPPWSIAEQAAFMHSQAPVQIAGMAGGQPEVPQLAVATEPGATAFGYGGAAFQSTAASGHPVRDPASTRELAAGSMAGMPLFWGMGVCTSPSTQAFGEAAEAAHAVTVEPVAHCKADALAMSGELMSSPVPLRGSALHDGSGRCHPCAWVWKPKGCSSGAACNYCHLCPEGELKRRKKAKIASLRMAEAQAKR